MSKLHTASDLAGRGGESLFAPGGNPVVRGLKVLGAALVMGALAITGVVFGAFLVVIVAVVAFFAYLAALVWSWRIRRRLRAGRPPFGGEEVVMGGFGGPGGVRVIIQKPKAKSEDEPENSSTGKIIDI